MNIFKKVIVFQLLLASMAFSAYSMRTNLSTFMQGGATGTQYPRFISEFRSHYPAYMEEINSILEDREAHKKGSKTWKSEPISRKQVLRLNNFLENMVNRVVLTPEIRRVRSIFNPRTESFKELYKEVTGKDIITEEGYEFHHIIPLELCGEKRTTYYTQTLSGNDPFNIIQLTVAEHRRLTDCINGL